jgi:membrane protein implicated in regulation of membrane protease activity
MEIYQITIIFGIIFVILELFTFNFIFLGMGAASFIVAIVQYLQGGFSINRDLLIFTIFTLVTILVSRKIFKKKADQQLASEDDVNQY